MPVSKKYIVHLLVYSLFFQTKILYSAAHEQPYGLDEQTGKFISDDITLLNEDSVTFPLKPLITKPTLLVFVYYQCPGLCPILLEGIVELVNYTDAIPGSEYQIITLSIDPEETTEMAKAKKDSVYKEINKPVDQHFWRFFTTDSLNIRKLTSGVGWQFRSHGNNFVHTTSTVLITPKGMVSQYFYGTYFNYMHFSMSVQNAAKELVVPTRLKNLKYCYNFRPEENKILKRLTVIYGVGILVIVFLLFLFLALRESEKTISGAGD